MKAAIYFEKPDKVPVWKAGLGDIFPLVMMPPKSWQPGHDESEKGLFPHAGDDLVIKLGLWKWKKPEWAKANPQYKGKKWLKVERDEVDEWGGVCVRGDDQH